MCEKVACNLLMYPYVPLVMRSERNMMLRMPITSKGHQIKLFSELIDFGNNQFALVDMKASTRKKAVLNIDDQKGAFASIFKALNYYWQQQKNNVDSHLWLVARL